MPTPWTKPQLDTHPVADWDLLQATAWRQAAPDELTQDSGGGHLATLALGTWLRDTGPSISLHVAARIGGDLPLALWIGLSTRAQSSDAALQGLRHHTADLGTLLDIWGQFRHPTPTPPPGPGADSLYLCSTTDDNDALLENDADPGYQGPTSFSTVFQALAGHPTPIGVQITLTPTLTDLEILRSAEHGMREIRARTADHFTPRDQRAFIRLLFVRDRAVSSRTITRLDGASSRAIQVWLATALRNDLMADVEFRPTPQQLELHMIRVAQVLQFLSLRSEPAEPGDAHQAFLEGKVPF